MSLLLNRLGPPLHSGMVLKYSLIDRLSTFRGYPMVRKIEPQQANLIVPSEGLQMLTTHLNTPHQCQSETTGHGTSGNGTATPVQFGSRLLYTRDVIALSCKSIRTRARLRGFLEECCIALSSTYPS